MYRVAVSSGSTRTENIYQALQLIEPSSLRSGPIVVKPNLLSARNRLASTHPDALSTVLSYLKSEFEHIPIIVAEGSHAVTQAVDKFNLQSIIEGHGAQWLNIDHREQLWDEVDFQLPCGTNTTIRVSRTVARAGMRVSLCIPKTHGNAVVSLSLKNMMGAIHPDDRPLCHGLINHNPSRRSLRDQDSVAGKIAALTAKWLRSYSKNRFDATESKDCQSLARSIAALARIIPPDISIIDGFSGMQGEGPWHGTKVVMRLAIASNSFHAADLIASQMMGFSPQTLIYTRFLPLEHRATLPSIKLIGNPPKKAWHFTPHSNFAHTPNLGIEK